MAMPLLLMNATASADARKRQLIFVLLPHGVSLLIIDESSSGGAARCIARDDVAVRALRCASHVDGGVASSLAGAARRKRKREREREREGEREKGWPDGGRVWEGGRMENTAEAFQWSRERGEL